MFLISLLVLFALAANSSCDSPNSSRIADAAKEDAAAAKLLSEVAQKKAGKADIKGRIAVLISILGFLVELAVNWDKLLEVFGNIASAFRQLLVG